MGMGMLNSPYETEIKLFLKFGFCLTEDTILLHYKNNLINIMHGNNQCLLVSFESFEIYKRTMRTKFIAF
jgi:hypothetical protein